MKKAADSIFRRRPDVRFRRVGGESVVIRQRAAEVLVLNQWGGRVLELLDGSRTLAEIAGLLSEEYEAPAETLQPEVIRFAGELLEAGIVEAAPEESP